MMRKQNDLIQLAILVVLGTSVLLSLALPQLARDRGDPQLLSLSVLFRDTDTAGWTAARQGMEQAADEFGAELRFLTLSSPNDSAEQEELLRREAEGGAHALVAVPADPAALSAALERLPVSCPVVTLESAMDNSAGTVAPDNDLLGRQLALALLEDWTGGEVLLLDTAGRSTGVSARLEAAQAALEEAGVPVRRSAALPGGEDQPRWVMAFEPSATQLTADTKTAEAYSFALYGVGSTTAIAARLERGVIAAAAAWSDYAAGYLAIQQAAQAAQGMIRETDPLTFSILRGEDIYEPDNQKLLFPVTS